MRSLFLLFGFFLLWCPAVIGAGKSSWTSVDGRELTAEGLSWSPEGVIVKSAKDESKILIPFEKLAAKDVVEALDLLPFRPNDEVKISAKSVSVKGRTLERETGDYVATVRLFTYDGYRFRGTATISPIKENFRISGRVVEVNLSSIVSDGYAALEFYAIRGKGDSKAVYHSECGVVKFKKLGSKAYFSAPAVEDFGGWVVVLRSPNTGEITEIESSMQHLEEFVTSQLPEEAKIRVNSDQAKRDILEALQKR